MEKTRYKNLYKLLGVIFAVWLIFFIIQIVLKITWKDLGQIGDSFGLLNALFSGLAFAGVIYAIFLQHEELRLQRQELAETRKVLKRSAEAQEKSEAALNRQITEMDRASRINLMSTIVSFNSLKTDVVELGFKTTAKGVYTKEVESMIGILDIMLADELNKVTADMNKSTTEP